MPPIGQYSRLVGSLEACLLRGSRGQGQDSPPQDRAEPLRLRRPSSRVLPEEVSLGNTAGLAHQMYDRRGSLRDGRHSYFHWSMTTKLDIGNVYLGAGERSVWTLLYHCGEGHPADARTVLPIVFPFGRYCLRLLM